MFINFLLNQKKQLETGSANVVDVFYKVKGAGVDQFIDSYIIDLRGYIYDLGNPFGAVDDDKSVNRRINRVADVWYGDTDKNARGRVLSHLDNRLIDPDGADGCETVTAGDLINAIKDIIGGYVNV